MKRFFLRYSHWLVLLIISISFLTMFISLDYKKIDIIAVVMGGIGFISITYLAIITEQHMRIKSKKK